ncbi:YeeE/YedE thiosulfate transporter family protein [Methyloligella sp. 2.7D]|uniref:YeeE/YedE family protein n=1 Tax=unclassified Methyloligella TaxID=2625955 RepID=UPI00157C86B5|nr:YeeE/YedE thiosulfate transporter family protein [Methyloligella sp. GL2]QKP76128.1 YeeE/YedE family protein [Methyloligella sp. GL2]
MSIYWPQLAGGALIGLSVALLMLLNGRTAGISGLLAGVFRKLDERFLVNALFVAGLILGPVIYRAVFGGWPEIHIQGGVVLLAIAGLLVGFGSRLGSGCTSGHGVAGMARLSPRSIAATLTFMATAILTVFVMGLFGL